MVNTITFFAKPTLVVEGLSGKFLFRPSGIVRGKQIADYLGGKFNPTEGWENDVKIFIKPRSLRYVKDGDYVDILDDLPIYTKLLKTRPGIKVIAMSTSHYDWLKSILPNEIIHIPHAHVNFDKFRRDRKEIINCGYIGTNKPYHIKINEEIGIQLAKVGLKFIPFFNYTTREEIINFYKQIDIQVIGYFNFNNDNPAYHEKKIVDAMSFGIPTIAGSKLGYKDVEGFYISVNNMDELVKEANRLKDPEIYNQWSDKIIKKSDKYHISEIVKLYKKL